MPELFPDYDCLWTVEQSYDCIRKRKLANVRHDEERAKEWGLKMLIFTSKEDAERFVLARAERQLADAQKSVMVLQKKIAALRKKYLQTPHDSATN